MYRNLSIYISNLPTDIIIALGYILFNWNLRKVNSKLNAIYKRFSESNSTIF